MNTFAPVDKSIDTIGKINYASNSNGSLFGIFIEKPNLDSIFNNLIRIVAPIECKYPKTTSCTSTMNVNNSISNRYNLIGAFWIMKKDNDNDHDNTDKKEKENGKKLGSIFVIDETGFDVFNFTKQRWLCDMKFKHSNYYNKKIIPRKQKFVQESDIINDANLDLKFNVKKCDKLSYIRSLVFDESLLIISNNGELIFFDITCLIKPRLMGKYKFSQCCFSHGLVCIDRYIKYCDHGDYKNVKLNCLKLILFEKENFDDQFTQIVQGSINNKGKEYLEFDISFLDEYDKIDESNIRDKIIIKQENKVVTGIRTIDSNENMDDKDDKNDEDNNIDEITIAEKANMRGQLKPIINTCRNTYCVVVNQKNETIIVTVNNTHIVLLNCNINQLSFVKHDLNIGVAHWPSMVIDGDHLHVFWQNKHGCINLRKVMQSVGGLCLLSWQIERLVWIGYVKNGKRESKCLLGQLAKDVIRHILSFLL